MADLFGIGSAVGSLFGGGKPPKNPYMDDAAKTAGGLTNYSNQYNNMASRAGADFNTYDPQAKASLQALTTLLGRSASGDDRASVAGTVFGNTDTAFNQGKSRIAADAAAAGGGSGITPGTDSFTAGKEAALEGFRATGQANALNAADDAEKQRQMQNAQLLLQILSGARGQALGEQTGALAAGQGVDTTKLNAYMGLSQEEAQRQAAAEAKRNAMLGIIAQIGQIWGQTGGFGGYGGGTGGGGGFDPSTFFSAAPAGGGAPSF